MCIYGPRNHTLSNLLHIYLSGKNTKQMKNDKSIKKKNQINIIVIEVIFCKKTSENPSFGWRNEHVKHFATESEVVLCGLCCHFLNQDF